MDHTLTVFFSVFKPVLIIFFVAGISALLVRKKIISQPDITSLSHLTVVLLLPCLMFSKIILNFDPSAFIYWWVLPIMAIIMMGAGLGIAALLFIKNIRQKRAYIALSGLMNANYMVLPIAQILFAEQFDSFSTYVFLFVLGVNPALWTVGKYLVSDNKGAKPTLMSFVTPPLAALVLALALVLTKTHTYIPQIIITPIDFIGKAAIPMTNIVLGAMLGSISLRQLPKIIDTIKVVLVKLFLLPILTIIILLAVKFSNQYALLADMLVIQASVAPASTLIIISRKYGGNSQDIGAMMLITYIICMFTIPLWLTVWRLVS